MVIQKALDEIKTYVNAELADPNSPPKVILENIAQYEFGANLGDQEGRIIMSVVNVEQDAVLRNAKTYTSISETEVRYHNPAISLNLYVLFSAVNNSYDEALKDLSELILCFQKKMVFTGSDIPNFNAAPLIEKLIFDYYSMTFEQLNHLWGILGGKYYPSVMYKVRLVTIFGDEGEEASVITSIDRRENSL